MYPGQNKAESEKFQLCPVVLFIFYDFLSTIFLRSAFDSAKPALSGAVRTG